MTLVEYFFAQMINGLSAGSIYALVAVGYSMVFGVLQMHNFSHGDTMMFGTYAAMAMLLSGVPPILAIPAAMMFGALLGMVIERVAFKPTRHAHRMVPTVSAIGVALILRNTAQLIWGTTTQPFPFKIPSMTFRIFNIGISSTQIIVLAVAAFLMLCTNFLVKHTLIGKAMRAVQQDSDAAGYMGIPVNRVITAVYMLGGFLGVSAGILFAMNYNTVFLMMGFTTMLKAFVAAIIGGIGNLRGAFYGGLILGVFEAFAAGFVSSGFRDAIVLGLLIIFLMVRPQGLFKTNAAVKV